MNNKVIVLALILLAISRTSIAQLAEINTGFTENFFDISFPSPDTGFIVGGGGDQSIILKSTDGGISWDSYTNPNTGPLYGVDFIDNNIGYTCGWEGVMYKTIDGGVSWNPLTTGTTDWIMSIHFVNADIGYCVGLNGLIMKTIDGGDSWTQQTSNTNEWLLSTFFTGENEGFAVGVGGRALKTIDGGSTWTSLLANTLGTLSDVFFLNDSTGFCSGFNGTIIKTTDYGNTWQVQNSGTIENLQSVSFFDLNNGYVVGDGSTILKTEDGGDTWTPVISPTTKNLNEVFLTSNNIVIAGDSGVVLVELPTSVKDVLVTPNILLYPNPTSDFINLAIDTDYSYVVVEVRNLLGQKMFYKEFLNHETLNIDLSGLNSAIYLLTLKIDGYSNYSFEILKN